MKFLLSLIADERDVADVTPEQMQADLDRMMAYNRELEQAGAYYLAGGLQELRNTKTVRFEGGEPIVSDGPFAETKEQLAGFWIIDCESFDEAIEWTKRIPIEDEGVVEVRPFAHELEGLPSESQITAEELLEGVRGDAPAGTQGR